MMKVNLEYNKIWRGRDERNNPHQRHEERFIVHEKRKLVSEEVRGQVDTALRAELVILKKALEKKKGKGKKGKKGKGKKGLSVF
jgi:hypothetical protein